METLGPHDRPREKLDRWGVGTLGDNELLATVIGHGTAGASAMDIANQALALTGGVHGLTRRRLRELLGIPGFGEAQAARVLAAIELGRRTLAHAPADRPKFVEPRAMALFLMPQFGSHPVERAGVVLLDARLRLIRVRLLGSGSIDACTIHPRDVFREALTNGATGVVVFHNHPSGDPEPSRDDVELTRRLHAAGRIMGTRLVDHVILADTRYCSFRETGLLPRDERQHAGASATSY